MVTNPRSNDKRGEELNVISSRSKTIGNKINIKDGNSPVQACYYIKSKSLNASLKDIVVFNE